MKDVPNKARKKNYKKIVCFSVHRADTRDACCLNTMLDANGVFVGTAGTSDRIKFYEVIDAKSTTAIRNHIMTVIRRSVNLFHELISKGTIVDEMPSVKRLAPTYYIVPHRYDPPESTLFSTKA